MSLLIIVYEWSIFFPAQKIFQTLYLWLLLLLTCLYFFLTIAIQFKGWCAFIRLCNYCISYYFHLFVLFQWILEKELNLTELLVQFFPLLPLIEILALLLYAFWKPFPNSTVVLFIWAHISGCSAVLSLISSNNFMYSYNSLRTWSIDL